MTVLMIWLIAPFFVGLVHELGRFAVAKQLGIVADTFSVGFGRTVWEFDHGGTHYRISMIPICGHIQWSPEEDSEDDPQSSNGLIMSLWSFLGDTLEWPEERFLISRWRQLLFYLAGPVMCFSASSVLFSGLAYIGGIQVLPGEVLAIIGSVEEGSAGEEAGLRIGDRIVAVADREISRWEEFAVAVETSPDRALKLTFERRGQRLFTILEPTKGSRLGAKGLRIAEVLPGSRAESAGLRPGDELRYFNGSPVKSISVLSALFQENRGAIARLVVARDGQLEELTMLLLNDDKERKMGAVFTLSPDLPVEVGDAGLHPRTQLDIYISSVLAASPAEAAGLRSGDRFSRLDGSRVRAQDMAEVVSYIGSRAGHEVMLEVLRGGSLQSLSVTPRISSDGTGKIGVQLSAMQTLSFVEAISFGVGYSCEITKKTLKVLARVFSREITPASARPQPVEFAGFVQSSESTAVRKLIFKIHFFLVMVATLSLLPIPALAGGHIAVVLFEMSIRRNLPVKIKQRINWFGYLLLLILVLVPLILDMKKLGVI